MNDILLKIIETKKEEIKSLKIKELQQKLSDSSYQVKDFASSLAKENLSVIAEIKQASPSAGIIVKDFDHQRIAKSYQEQKADAISCLTDEKYFLGNKKYLQDIRPNTNIPILRKEFIISLEQIYESLLLEADAILLIAACLDKYELNDFFSLSSELNLHVLFEIHDEYELDKVLEVNPKILGINNRNLRDFSVDIDTSVSLGKRIPENIIKVSESGIKTIDDILIIKENNFDAVLIGQSLMEDINLLASIKNG